MHCDRPPLGPIQGDARFRGTRPAPNPIRIHGHQAHLYRSGQSLHPHRDGPHRPYRHP